MNMMIKVTDGDCPLSEWLAERIRMDVMEKYGIEIEVAYEGASSDHSNAAGIHKNKSDDVMFRNQLKDLKQNKAGSRRSLDLSEWNDLPMVLEPKHLKFIMDIGINQVLKLIRKDPPFFVVKIGNRYKIAKVSFFEWLTGKDSEV